MAMLFKFGKNVRYNNYRLLLVNIIFNYVLVFDIP